MATTRARRGRRVSRTTVRRRSSVKPGVNAAVYAPAEPKPVRGVKLKTVSLLTMLFSLLCLGAFLAGRPPLIAARLDSGNAETHSRATPKAKKTSAHGRAERRLKLATAATNYGTLSYGTMMRGGS
jgi:hypothetical protein